MFLPIARSGADGRVVDRRALLRSGGVLGGAAAVLAVPGLTRAGESLTVDMAEDIRTMTINGLPATQAERFPTVGDTFIEWGSLYPAGTIERGLAGPDQPGAIGRWICRGTFFVDVATVDMESGVTPTIATTVLLIFGDGLSSTAGELGLAADGLVTEGVEGNARSERIVTGGLGRYAGARGVVTQSLVETNNLAIELAGVTIPAANYTFAFTFGA